MGGEGCRARVWLCGACVCVCVCVEWWCNERGSEGLVVMLLSSSVCERERKRERKRKREKERERKKVRELGVRCVCACEKERENEISEAWWCGW